MKARKILRKAANQGHRHRHSNRMGQREHHQDGVKKTFIQQHLMGRLLAHIDHLVRVIGDTIYICMYNICRRVER